MGAEAEDRDPMEHESGPLGIGIVGCGYVADNYMRTTRLYPDIRICGAYDRDLARLSVFGRYFSCPTYATFDALLANPAVRVIVNLTNPRSHYDVTRRALLAGRHVYTEKPLALDLASALELVQFAEARGLEIGCAPCTLLSETAQTLWRALRSQSLGRPRLVYAQLDEGPIHWRNPAAWTNQSGAIWPAADEFETGCTGQHAGYIVTWLVAFFGPVKRLVSYATLCVPDKLPPGSVGRCAPDFSTAVLEFESDVVARVTFGIVGPPDSSISIMCTEGHLVGR